MMPPRQAAFISRECPTGSEEAERLFQLAGDYHQGRKGLPVDFAKAERLYQEALGLGNAKAALNLGILYLYRHDYGQPERFADEETMFQLFQKAADMGCPEGTYSMATAYSKGRGVDKNQRKAKALMKWAAEQGALNAMVEHGLVLYKEGRQQEGIAWLEKSLALGNGDAADDLSTLYTEQGDAERAITALRRGCKLGSRTAILGLCIAYTSDLRHLNILI
ncbi:MAG: sel1 repeat family protein [Desulfovibrio sp.]|nr:sel1 repeat family protein [Desulfovibrio sp.]